MPKKATENYTIFFNAYFEILCKIFFTACSELTNNPFTWVLTKKNVKCPTCQKCLLLNNKARSTEKKSFQRHVNTSAIKDDFPTVQILLSFSFIQY